MLGLHGNVDKSLTAELDIVTYAQERPTGDPTAYTAPK